MHYLISSHNKSLGVGNSRQERLSNSLGHMPRVMGSRKLNSGVTEIKDFDESLVKATESFLYVLCGAV